MALWEITLSKVGPISIVLSIMARLWRVCYFVPLVSEINPISFWVVVDGGERGRIKKKWHKICS